MPSLRIPKKDFEQEYQQKGAYHIHAKEFDRWFLDRNYKLIASETSAARRVLDIGCGDGAIGDYFSDDTYIMGVDASPKAVELARSSKFREFLCTQIPPIPFPDDSFDAVISSLTLQYVDPADWEVLLADIKRVLRPNGIFCFSYINIEACADFYKHLPEEKSVSVMPIGDLRSLLRSAGFAEQACRGTNLLVPSRGTPGFWLRFRWALAGLLGQYLPQHSYHVVLSAQKGN